MNTKEAARYLGTTASNVFHYGRTGRIKRTLDSNGNTVWDEDDLVRAKVFRDRGVYRDWDWAKQYTVIYCRTEPADGLAAAPDRLQAQRERMINFAVGRGFDPDMILSEVRPALRYRTSITQNKVETPNAFMALLSLLSQKKVKTLIIETRDRLCAVDSWFMMEELLRSMYVQEVVVANSVWPTQEQKLEAKSWLGDVLLRYKVLAGEIIDPSITETFMKGYDPKLTFRVAAEIEAALTRREKNKKLQSWKETDPKGKILDLSDCFVPAIGPVKTGRPKWNAPYVNREDEELEEE